MIPASTSHFRDEEMHSEDTMIRSCSSLVVNCDLHLYFGGLSHRNHSKICEA